MGAADSSAGRFQWLDCRKFTFENDYHLDRQWLTHWKIRWSSV